MRDQLVKGVNSPNQLVLLKDKFKPGGVQVTS